MIFSEARRSDRINRLLLVLLGILFMYNCHLSYAQAKDKCTMTLGIPYKLEIANNEDKKVEYSLDEFSPCGDMKLYKNSYEVDSDGDTTGMWEIVTDDSEEFTFKPIGEKSFEDFYIHARSGIHVNKIARAIWCEQIKLTKDGLEVVGEKGSTCTYYIGMYSTEKKLYYNADGAVIGNVYMYKDANKDIKLKGAKGRNVITLCSDKKNNTVVAKGEYYLYGDPVTISRKGEKAIAKPGICISTKKSKSVTSLYLRPANKGKNMFLTWNRVKGAKSYIVYKYSPVKNEFVKVAIRDSHNANYYNIPKADNAIGYKYKVVAKAQEEGKGKKVCKDSYAVWAVAAGNAKGNVTSVITNKKKVTSKAGKSIKLTAKVATDSKLATGTTKKVLSKTIRWYSSNKKIARINKETGKVKFLRKGKCYIWAKAHNGKNSKKIKVVVK